jgi:hypothetical protein
MANGVMHYCTARGWCIRRGHDQYSSNKFYEMAPAQFLTMVVAQAGLDYATTANTTTDQAIDTAVFKQP